MSQPILTNVVIASSGRLANILLGVLITAALTRLLGPANYGTYTLLISFGTIIQLLADGGLYLTLSRRLAIASGSADSLISSVVSLRLFLLIVTFALGLLLVFIIPSFYAIKLLFVIIYLGLSFQSFSQLAMSIFQNRQIVWRATVGDLAGRIAQLLVILISTLVVASLTNIVIAFTFGSFIALVFHYCLLPPTKLRLISSWPKARQLLVTSWPLGALLIINAIYFRIDILILSLFTSSAEVGLYGVAYRLVESTLFFPAMLGGLLLPKLTTTITGRLPRQAGRYLAEALKLVIVVAALGAIIIQFHSRTIINLISGPQFLSAGSLLVILSWAMVLMFLGNIFGFTLVSLKKQFFLLKLYTCLAFLNIIANLIFIPLYGVYGAAWTTVATELTAASAAGVMVYHHLPWRLSVAWLVKLGLVLLITTIIALIPTTIEPIIHLLLLIIVFVSGVSATRLLSKLQLRLLTSHD